MIIVEMASLKCFQETPQSLAAMNDLAVASKVRATLVCNPSTVDLELDVTVAASRVATPAPEIDGFRRERDRNAAHGGPRRGARDRPAAQAAQAV